MSVDTQQLERSALERKDRDELHTIAVALGGKPSSRARKAEIVDLILELAGVAPAAPGAGSGSRRAAGPGPDAHPRGNGRAPAAEADSDTVGLRRGREPDGADASTEDATADVEATEDRSTDEGGPTEAPNAEPTQNGGPGANQGQGEGEGNRRRRRRGRDRGERSDRPADRPDADQPFQGEPVEVEGLLDLRDEGYGFLRLVGYLPSKDDVYISVKQVRQFALRKGDRVTGAARPAGRNEKNPAMLRIDAVNGVDPEVARQRPRFEDLTPLFPDERLRLEVPGDPDNMTARIVDLISPIGKGQRGLIVSPPKAGKTTVMKQIARSIETNNPEVHLIVLLVDERPEEVTDMRRWVQAARWRPRRSTARPRSTRWWPS